MSTHPGYSGGSPDRRSSGEDVPATDGGGGKGSEDAEEALGHRGGGRRGGSRRGRGRAVPAVTGRELAGMVAVMAGAFVAAGVVAGVLWSRIGLAGGPIEMVMGEHGPVFRSESAAGHVVAMDGWFTVLGVIGSAVVGSVLFVVFRRRGAWAVGCLTVASMLGSITALSTGTLVANDQLIVAWEPRAEIGSPLSAPLTVHAYAVLLAWPITVLVAIAVLAWLGTSTERENNPI